MQSHPTPCEAIRVFCGYAKPELNRAAFFKGVGETFMPGTPYMLQPMGLAAYLPGVLAAPPPGLPDEFALICYPSVEVWDVCMHDTLRGRVYNQSHGGVYASNSGAAFPKRLADITNATPGPFFLFDKAIDWQSGQTHVVVAARDSALADGITFRTHLHASLRGGPPDFAGQGFDQVITTAFDDFCILWFHREGDGIAPQLDALQGIVAGPTVIACERVICRDEPPPVLLEGDRAFNFVFLRDERYFLE
jgi:hypothetical protein